jgi:glycosyltransferase involved in cell wall biosynthesis
MPDPLVSIVVCTYNGEAFLREQLESLLSQTYKNLEILIVDDRSTDLSKTIAQEFASMDNRIRVVVNPMNLGYNKNFEQSFYLAQGEFIAVSDQDDVWVAEKIEKMMKLFREDEILLAHCQSVRFRKGLPEIKTSSKRRHFEGNDVRQLMFFNTISGHNIMFRKKLLKMNGPFPPGVYYDWWLAIIAAAYGKIIGTTEVLTFHRYHDSNLTLGKKDEGKQTRAKADERIQTIGSILQLKELTPGQKEFANQIYAALLTLKNRTFSLRLFRFLSRNAGIIFFFKKKSMFSKLKMAYRMSFAVS